MRFLPLNTRLLAWGLGLVVVAGMTGCPLASNTITQPEATYEHPDNDSYGNGAIVDATVYDSIYLRPGDKFTVDFGQKVNSLPAPINGLTISSSGNQASIRHTASAGSVIADLSFTLANSQTYSFHAEFGEYMWPGDANSDGRRNMLDLYPLAVQYNRSPLAGPPANPGSPVTGTALNRLYPRSSWARSISWGGQTIDLCHADANFDGTLNRSDLAILTEVLTPVAQPTFLLDSVNRIQLKATPTGQVIRSGLRLVTVPYRISIESLVPPGSTNAPPSALDILGVIFTRPVTETSDYTVHSIDADLRNSNLVMSKDSMLGHQKYWRHLKAVPQGQNCTEAVAKALDVGVFNNESSKYLGLNSEIISCGVTIEDILRPFSGGVAPSFPVFFHIYNGIVFRTNSSGDVIAVPAACSSDSTMIDVNEACAPDLVVRETYSDWGAEPFEDSLSMGQSPDIWVRNANDHDTIHQNPVTNAVNFVGVRIHNNGCLPAVDPKGSKLELYWTVKDPALDYPGDLNGTVGGLIDIEPIPSGLGPFSSQTFLFKWETPDFASLLASKGLPPNSRVALVARINSSWDPENTDPNLHTTLLYNNNFAIRYSSWTP